jgi:hypothetical protein
MRKLLVALTATATVMAATPAQGLAKPASTTERAHAHFACKTLSCKRRVGHKQTVRRWKQIVAPYRAWLNKVGSCEADSSGGYHANTGNGFYGRYQFTISTWASVGGRGLPHQASPLEQDVRAIRVLHAQGRGAWPVCG